MAMTEEEKIIEQLNELINYIRAKKSVIGIKEAAWLTGYRPSHIYQLVSRREIPHYKRGKTLYFKKEEILQWMVENKVEVKK